MVRRERLWKGLKQTTCHLMKSRRTGAIADNITDILQDIAFQGSYVDTQIEELDSRFVAEGKVE